MKITITALAFTLMLFAGDFAQAQELEFPELDKSSLDMASYPRSAAFNNYLDEKEDLKVRVLYSRPRKNDREIFGDLVPYGEEWRLGANEATEITFMVPVSIGGTTVPAGTYTMTADVHPDHWDVNISKERFIGGNANRDKSQDIVTAKATVKHVADSREAFTIGFKKINESSCKMIMAWDRTVAYIPIGFNPAFMAGDDASPMDLAQYPNMSRFRNFVKPEELEMNEPQVRVVYSRPQKKGRTIFGELLKYGQPWRIGANESTEITFFNDVKIGDGEVKAGTYGVFAVVNEDNWEFVIHKNLPTWGPANHDEETNVAKLVVTPQKSDSVVEVLSIVFDEASDSEVHMVVAWDNVVARLPITLMGKEGQSTGGN